jgi:hypothetical protein
VLAGNIGKFSLPLRQCGKGLFLQGGGMTMMILVQHFAAGAQTKCGPEKGNTKVTIYSGTDCKLYGVVREGELLGRRVRTFTGTTAYHGEGEWDGWPSRFG